MNLILILQGMDMIFTRLIFLPALIILYFKFRPRRPWTIRTRRLYYLCLILVGLYLLRLFCAGFLAFGSYPGSVSLPNTWEFVTRFLTIYV